jgi:hypothetical protein
MNEIMKRFRLEVTDEVRVLIRAARFPHTDLAASSENIAICLRQIAENSLPSSFFVTEHIFRSVDYSIAANLSIFGHQSISFMNTGGKLIDLWSVKGDDPNTKTKKKISIQELVQAKKGKKKYIQKDEEVYFWDRVVVSRVPIDMAITDFLTVKKTHKIAQLQSYDTKIVGNTEIHSSKSGENEILDQLRAFGGVEEDFEKVVKKAKFEEAPVIGLVDKVAQGLGVDLGF